MYTPADPDTARTETQSEPRADIQNAEMWRLRKPLQIATYLSLNGHVAEWLRNGLQNRVPRFNSGRGLQITTSENCELLRANIQRLVRELQDYAAARLITRP